MNKIKLLVAGGSLAFAMLATGCATDKCADANNDEKKCKETKEDGTQCVFQPDANDKTKGKCVKGGANKAGSAPAADTKAKDDEIAKLKADLAKANMSQGGAKLRSNVCMRKKDLSKVCTIADSVKDAMDARKTACEAIKNGNDMLCKFTPAGTCKLSDTVCALGSLKAVAGAIAGSLNSSALTSAAVCGTLKAGAKGTLIAAGKVVCAASGDLCFTKDGLGNDDPCSAKKTAADCDGAELVFWPGSNASSLLVGNDTHGYTDLKKSCIWNQGPDLDKSTCELDHAMFAKVDCGALTTKGETDCGKNPACEWGVPHKDVVETATTTTQTTQQTM